MEVLFSADRYPRGVRSGCQKSVQHLSRGLQRTHHREATARERL